MLLLDKITDLQKRVTALEEMIGSFEALRHSLEKRQANLDKKLTVIQNKMDELAATVNCVFVESGTEVPTAEVTEAVKAELSGETTAAVDYEVDADGSLLVKGEDRTTMEERGFRVVGSVSRDAQTRLKMREV